MIEEQLVQSLRPDIFFELFICLDCQSVLSLNKYEKCHNIIKPYRTQNIPGNLLHMK